MAAMYLLGAPPPTRSEPFFSWGRLCRECCVLGFIVSWVLMAWLLFSASPGAPESVLVESSLMASMATRRGSGCGNRPRVHVQSTRSGMYWAVRAGNVIVADEAHPQTVFRIEPIAELDSANTSFAIRHVETLRLVSVNPPGSDGEFMLRLGPLRVETPFELFTVRSLSIESVGIGGLINHRDRTQVRAHGNVEPWQPMQIETTATRIILREIACQNPHLLEDALIGMLDALRKQGHTLPLPFPGTSKTRRHPSLRASSDELLQRGHKPTSVDSMSRRIVF